MRTLLANGRIEKLLAEFNNRYKGKEVNWCSFIGAAINFNPENVLFCCSSTTGSYPVICGTSDKELNTLNKEKYIEAMIHTIDANQEVGPCNGCKQLKRVLFQEIEEKDIKIKDIVWNHFRGCNSKCVYCGDGDKFHAYYEPLDVVKRFVECGGGEECADKVNISWGGGEPSLLSNIELYINYAKNKGWEQLLNTSGLICKDCIIDVLREDPNFAVQISVDSGTREIYKKVKGQNGYDLVWKTIKRYCEIEGKVFVKYIVFSYNSDKREIDEFISKCVSVGVKNIVASGESGSSWQLEGKRIWTFEKNEEDAVAYLMDQGLEHNIAVYFSSGNFSLINSRNIMARFIEKYLANRLRGCKICIWAMGAIGKNFADLLIRYNLEIECFGDSDLKKKGTDYRGIVCKSLEELKLSAVNTKYYVFIALENYREMYEKLSREIPGVGLGVWIFH